MAAASAATAASSTSSTTLAPRLTPSPACLYPFDSIRDNDLCDHAYATSWRGCPAGYTSACGRLADYDLSQYTTPGPLIITGPMDRETTATFITKIHRVICCPDLMPWVCGGSDIIGRNAQTDCVFVATAPTVFEMGPAPLTPYTVSSAQSLTGHAVTASRAVVTRMASWAAAAAADGDGNASGLTIVETATATAWCDLPACADLTTLPFASVSRTTVAGTTATAGDFILQPPQHMGRIGNLGIFALSGLLGAIIFAAALLLPSAMEYRKRKRLQVQSQ